LQQEHEQTLAELATYRQRDVDASEEERARQQYEDLRKRFEPEPPTPIANQQARGWEEGSATPFGARERTGTGGGWPT
jgi:hypothetical protein